MAASPPADANAAAGGTSSALLLYLRSRADRCDRRRTSRRRGRAGVAAGGPAARRLEGARRAAARHGLDRPQRGDRPARRDDARTGRRGTPDQGEWRLRLLAGPQPARARNGKPAARPLHRRGTAQGGALGRAREDRRRGADRLAGRGRGGGRLVLLLPPRKGIGAARLEIVGADERTRVVRLPKIRIGSTVPGGRRPVRRIRPGLALDSSTGHAYVVGTDGVVAGVDVRSLKVSNHSLVRRSLAARLGAWLVPAAEGKALAGPALEARWLGDGLIAVAGTSYSVTFGKNSETQTATPLGLRVVDVHTWTQRTLDAGADGFAVGNGALLAYGVRSEFGTTTPSVVSGMGVAAYGTDGNKRFHLLPTVPVGSLQVNGSLAYGWLVDAADPWHLVVLDVAAGTVVRELRLAHPTRLLIADSSFFYG